MILPWILPYEQGLSQGCGVAGDEEAGLEGVGSQASTLSSGARVTSKHQITGDFSI